ncbi:hypothetical protein Wcon_01394 [Wolbachia endosymbiont of Cylisticus convexus]|uniref:ankyrin repeat domain-containing protein n=1 Tax=Wolbachia endosymbiont of Cylisticus convexus TaxID=118728 RepID=UPI000E144BD6|nr:Ankyrin repeat protein [Wolbachia endosymbiont of Cylisticus convexus]RDD33703.1 hypothetical protein Wcon_02282 [Wolbachia endosymbiont of Cylisticus convexus]RDD34434.1 hypothetical protein Wcon_01481 [Wolbachia endosymbiont of Cylisticus convexus]RDD34507.1 hypothetical protein Wcon_01394 [Wolbachia endosymbiont of Cylisticus convexus]
MTPLHLDALKVLLDNGADTSIQDNNGNVALHFANLNNSQALLQAAEPNGNMNNVNVENLYGPEMGR